MPKKIDAELKARAVRLVNDHRGGYSSLTAAAAVVAKQLGVGKESVRRSALQADIDGGQRDLEVRDDSLRRGTRPPQPLTMAHRHHEEPRPRGRVDLPGPA